MKIPCRDEIIAEAIRLFFNSEEVDNFNTPELGELREAGLLVEARNNLMRRRSPECSPEKSHVAVSTRYIIKLKEVNCMDWVEEWKKRDPYFQDVEGFTKFVEEKEKELHVVAGVSVNRGHGEGYRIWLEVPYEELPEEHRKQSDEEEERRINKLVENLTEALKQIGFNDEAWSRLFHSDMPEPETLDGKLTHGSTTVFRYYPFEIPPPLNMEIKSIEDLEQYVRRRLEDSQLFSYEERSTNELTTDSEARLQKRKSPTFASRVVKTAWMQPNKKEYADYLIDSEIKTRLAQFKEGQWYWYGDEAHSERIHHNAKVMLKLWETVGKLIPGCFLIHKDYDMRTIYFGIKSKKKEVRLPPYSISRWDIQRVVWNAYQYGYTIHSIEVEEPTEPYWREIEVLTKAVLEADIPNTEDPFEDGYVWYWEEGTPMPVVAIWMETIPEVIKFLAVKKYPWEPEYDDGIMRNGGLDIVHPFLRKSRVLVWDDAVLDEETEWMRRTYYATFTREELEEIKVEDLKEICQAKNLNVVRRKDDMIHAILEANFRGIENG